MAVIGILGGTFNPIHYAHLAMAESAYEQANLDVVWFMPTKNPPHKQGMKILDESMRSDMIKLAIKGKPHFVYSDFELQRERITYTADTLLLLKEKYPEDTFYFILGGDSLFQFENWYCPDKIMERASLLAISRDGTSQEKMLEQKAQLERKYGGSIKIIAMPQMDISSSCIRKAVVQGKDISNYVPKEVEDYIKENHCYGI